MSITTVLGYLVGRRQAILDIAATPAATWLGLLWVMSAGFAREYDGEDLLAAPWHLLLPLGASLFLSGALYCLVACVAWGRGCREGTFLGNYAVFLRLFWMTAPLAWLYAIPVEQFLSAGGATRANLWILAIVSGWRVILTIRVVSVLYGATLRAAAMPVLLFADTIALVALYLAPLPVFSIMGGIRLSESERLIQNTAFIVGFFGTIAWPIWLVGTCYVSGWAKTGWSFQVPSRAAGRTVSGGLWAVAAGALLVGCGVLPWTQPKQQLRSRVERELRRGELASALGLMSAHERADFPRHWEPPPRIGYGETNPPLLDVLEAVCADGTKPWVRTVFVDKMDAQSHGFGGFGFWSDLDEEDLARCLTVVETLPECLEIVREMPRAFERIHRQEELDPELRRRVRNLLEAAGHEVEQPDDDAVDRADEGTADGTAENPAAQEEGA